MNPGQPGQPGQQVPPGSPGYGNFFRMTQVDQILTPRFYVDNRGGGLYGYNAGYTNIGAFVPYKLEDNAILFASAMGMVTYDGRGGATLGGGWRYYIEGLDRIAGLSAWFDLDNGHAQPYQQLGLSFESLGRYTDYRVNGYLPISHPDHILVSDLTQTAALIGNGIGLLRNNVVEQASSGIDGEIGGPTPFLGRYGLNAYIGAYHLMGMGAVGGNTTGVSGRLLSQINEDVSFGVQVTNDHLFGLNTQFQVFVNLPNGKSGRWLRNLRVRDRLNQNVFRQYRVLAKTQQYQSYDTAINPGTHQPYFVENINPNLTTNGNGTAANPFNSIAAYEALPLATRERVDIILVQPRTDATTTNLDTGALGTLELFNGQRLLSTAIPHSFTTDNFPGVVMTIPAVPGATDPMLFNSTGGNVITLASGTTRGIEVSGFEIIGSATGSGIVGNNNVNVNINNNNIHSGLNGVSLTNLTGTFATGTQAMFIDNNVHDNLGAGIQVTNDGSPPFVPPLDVLVTGNTFATNGTDGLKLVAEAGATIGGLIGGANIPATSTTPLITNANIFNANVGNGLDLVANGGTLNFNAAAIAAVAAKAATATTPATAATLAVPSFGIFNNTFTANTLDGLHIDTSNSSISTFAIQNNAFGLQSDNTSGNKQFGIGLLTDSGTTTMLIGGDIVTNTDGTTSNPGNTFDFNGVSAINLAASGTAILNYNIDNNTIRNTINANIPPRTDAFTFTFNGTSGTDPFSLVDTSDTPVSISTMTWNTSATVATFAPTSLTNPVVVQTPSTDTYLTQVNSVAVQTGTVPLILTGGGARNANDVNLNFPANGQVLPLTFGNNNLLPGAPAFTATALMQLPNSNKAQVATDTRGSTVTVGFSDGLTATATAQLNAAGGVTATGSVQSALTPGSGTGGDGIHVIASGSSTLNTSVIQNNTVTGYGGYGIHVETAGTAVASHVLVLNNTLMNNGIGDTTSGVATFTGGGLEISRHDSSTLNAIIETNTITNNFNNGLSLTADGTATGGLTVNTQGNTITGNAGNGLSITTGGAAILSFTTNGETFSGNGIGLPANPNKTTGGDNVTVTTNGTSVANITLNNVVSGVAAGNGFSATTNDQSTLNLVIAGVSGGLSNYSNNGLNGILLASNGDSYMHANIYNTQITQNSQNGLVFARNGASLVRSSIVNTNISGNAVDGLVFRGLGSDPQDPNQQMTGTPSRIILLDDTLNSNGNFGTGVGQGVRLDLFGDSELVLDANATSFSNNAQNGLRIRLDPGAEFGYEVGNERSILDNVQINNNGSNGIFLTSDISPTQGASLNNNLPFDAPSVTFMQISANTGNTTINHNGFGTNATGQSGILMQYLGGNHDILITGDENPAAPTFTTVIQSNKLDGILSQTSLEGDVTLTVDKVTVGGPVAANGNGADGIAFETQASLTIVDGSSVTQRNFNGSGIGNLVVSNSLIENNLGNGISLIGNDFAVNDGSIGNAGVDLAGLLNATITGSTIINNGKDGINILLNGEMGDFREPEIGSGLLSTFTINNNTISSNGLYGGTDGTERRRPATLFHLLVPRSTAHESTIPVQSSESGSTG